MALVIAGRSSPLTLSSPAGRGRGSYEGCVQEIGQFGFVDGRVSGGGAGARGTAGVVQGSREEETGGDESPGAHVLGFFLDPDGVFGGGIGREQRSQDVCREGVELLESDDRGVGGFALGSFGLEVVEDFAAAEEETLDLEEVRSLRIINDGLEA